MKTNEFDFGQIGKRFSELNRDVIDQFINF